MLAPKKVKHRKWQRGDQIKGFATRKNKINFGEFGLKTLDAGWISSRQIEAARRVLTRYIQKGGKVWIRIFPDKPITLKGAETPMGKGKGAVDHYIAEVKPGTVMFEISGIKQEVAKEAMVKSGHKLPVHTKFITKE
jgi:large subunit ribosomal protein L16